MIAPKLAFRNLMGAKLRTWLNIIVLSMAYVIIIWQQGFLDEDDQKTLLQFVLYGDPTAALTARKKVRA